jgi:hypothetical protein
MGSSRRSHQCRAHKSRWPVILRGVLVLLVAVGLACVQTASALETHPDHHGGASDHCCAGCHAGHFPVLHTINTVQLGPLQLTAWRAFVDIAPDISDNGLTLNSSRAPPV